LSSNKAEANVMTMNVSVADHFILDGPNIFIKVEPGKLNLTKNSSAMVTANVTYNYKPGFNAPQTVSIKLVPTESAFDLKAVSGLSPR